MLDDVREKKNTKQSKVNWYWQTRRKRADDKRKLPELMLSNERNQYEAILHLKWRFVEVNALTVFSTSWAATGSTRLSGMRATRRYAQWPWAGTRNDSMHKHKRRSGTEMRDIIIDSRE